MVRHRCDLILKLRVVGRVPNVETTVGSQNLSCSIENTAQDIDDADKLQPFETFRRGNRRTSQFFSSSPGDVAADRAAGPPHFGSGVTLPFWLIDRVGLDGVTHAATVALLPL